MTTVFQQAIQLIALALGFGFLKEFAAIAAFEPVQDLVWKLLMSLGFIYMATKVPSMLGNHGTFDSWLSDPLLRHEPALVDGQVGQDHRADGGRGRRGAGRHGGGSDGGQRGRLGSRQRPQLGGLDGHPIGRRGRRRRSPPEQRRVAPQQRQRQPNGAAPSAPINQAKEVGRCASR